MIRVTIPSTWLIWICFMQIAFIDVISIFQEEIFSFCSGKSFVVINKNRRAFSNSHARTLAIPLPRIKDSLRETRYNSFLFIPPTNRVERESSFDSSTCTMSMAFCHRHFLCSLFLGSGLMWSHKYRYM